MQLVGAKAMSAIGQDIVPNSYVLWVASNPGAATFSVTLAPGEHRCASTARPHQRLARMLQRTGIASWSFLICLWLSHCGSSRLRPPCIHATYPHVSPRRDNLAACWPVLTDGIRDVAGNALVVPAATIIPVMATSSAAAVTVAAAGPASSALASAPDQGLQGVNLGASAAAQALADSSNMPAVRAASLLLCGSIAYI